MKLHQNSKEHKELCEVLKKLLSKKKFSKDMLSIVKLLIKVLLKREREKIEPETCKERMETRQKHQSIVNSQQQVQEGSAESGQDNQQMEEVRATLEDTGSLKNRSYITEQKSDFKMEFEWNSEWETCFQDVEDLVSNRSFWTLEDANDWK